MLDCQPGDILEFQRAEDAPAEKKGPFTESINPNGTKNHHAPGLAEGSWKGMKKSMETDRRCEKLRGRGSYQCEVYSKFGSNAVFTVSLDGEAKKKFGYYPASAKLDWPEGYLWSVPMENRDEYSDSEFAEALEAYRRQPIADSLASKNPIQRMFAIVDRRVGKRTLQKLAASVQDQPEWLRAFYLARMEAEGVAVK